MPSRRLQWDHKDTLSALRHAIMPAVAGASLAAVEAVQQGEVSIDSIGRAIVVALASGVLRALQRWLHDFEAER